MTFSIRGKYSNELLLEEISPIIPFHVWIGWQFWAWVIHWCQNGWKGWDWWRTIFVHWAGAWYHTFSRGVNCCNLLNGKQLHIGFRLLLNFTSLFFVQRSSCFWSKCLWKFWTNLSLSKSWSNYHKDCHQSFQPHIWTSWVFSTQDLTWIMSLPDCLRSVL